MDRRSFLFWALAATPGYKLLGQAAVKSAPLPVFVDVTAKSGIRFKQEASRTSQKYLPESMGGGVAMFDYNNDGYLDLFFVNGAQIQDPMPRGALPDKSNPRYWNRLYRNNGDGTFTDVTENAGVQGHSYGMGVAVGDFDNDGNMDLLVANLGGNILYHNNGDGTFTDVSKKCGIAASPGKGLGIAINDFDRDGWPDIFVANDSVAEQLFRNNRDGTFTEVALEAGLAYDQNGRAFAGMGADFADYDNDGWPDVFVNALANQKY